MLTLNENNSKIFCAWSHNSGVIHNRDVFPSIHAALGYEPIGSSVYNKSNHDMFTNYSPTIGLKLFWIMRHVEEKKR